MYCQHCGKELPEECNYCPGCGHAIGSGESAAGARTEATGETNHAKPLSKTASAGWAILGYFFPVVGLILYLVWMDEKPAEAKMCGKGALISVIVNGILSVLAAIVAFIVIAVTAGTTMWVPSAAAVCTLW